MVGTEDATVRCAIAPRQFVLIFKRFGETFCFHLQDRDDGGLPHRIATRKIDISIFIAMRTSDLI
jgi:hypothetical protein